MHLGDNIVYALLSLLAGLAVAYVLYKRRVFSPRTIFYWVVGLRGTVLALIFFLFLAPSFEQLTKTIHPPVVVFALDNSESVMLSPNPLRTKEALGSLYGEVLAWAKRKKIALRCHNISSYQEVPCPTAAAWQHTAFDGKTSNISRLITEAGKVHDNLSGIVLASDGIFNEGISPAHVPFSKKIFTVGLGDPSQRKDIAIRQLKYNRTVQQGNQFFIEAQITQTGYATDTLSVQLRKGNNTLSTKRLRVQGAKGSERVLFLLSAEKEGVHTYSLSVSPKAGEITHINNNAKAYVEVVKQRTHILLLTQAPHPDVGAIGAALESKGSRKVHIHTLSMQKGAVEDIAYDAIVWYDAFSSNEATAHYKKITEHKKIPTWFFLTTRSVLRIANRTKEPFSLQKEGKRSLQVAPSYNPSFSTFQLPATFEERVRDYPAISVPHLKIRTAFPLQTIFFQRIEDIPTTEKLWCLGERNNQRIAFSLGSGCWQWRVQETVQSNTPDAFDEVVSKVIQYLSLRTDKKKFKVYPLRVVFSQGEPIRFRTEIHNDLYEPLFGQEVVLEITQSKKKKKRYTYRHTQEDYAIPFLPEGSYSYLAKTTMDKVAYTQGKFSVTPFSIESSTLQANFEPLQRLSKNTGGYFAPLSKKDRLLKEMAAWTPPKKISQSTQTRSLLDTMTLLLLIAFLLILEWLLRKMYGQG